MREAKLEIKEITAASATPIVEVSVARFFRPDTKHWHPTGQNQLLQSLALTIQAIPLQTTRATI